MAENIQEYGIEIGFEDALRKISKLRTAQKNMNKIQEGSLKRQISLQKRLNSLQKAGVGVSKTTSTSGVISTPSGKTSKTSETKDEKEALRLSKAKHAILKRNRLFISKTLSDKEKIEASDLASKIHNAKNVDELRDALSHTKQRISDEKKLAKEEKRRIAATLKAEKDAIKQLDAERKSSLKQMTSTSGMKAKDTALAQMLRDSEAKGKLSTQAESARRGQSLSQMTSSSGAPKAKDTAFASMLKEEEKAALKAKQEQAKVDREQLNLAKAKSAVLNRDRLFTSRILNDKEKIVARDLASKVHNAKNVEELRDAVKQTRQRLADNKKIEKSLKRQNFALQRLQSSSKQLAGNMVSAFAVTAGISGIVKVGQDFESVNNTMLAVSDNATVAGENFQFVKEKAFELGLGLKESAKGFAKMVAARGDMSLKDVKASFTGLSEMSTLLGLSADQSSRAINALQQMMSKGSVSAKFLAL